jgi:DNA replication protein DnaC
MGQTITSFIDFKTFFTILIGSGGLILSVIPVFFGHSILIFISNYFKYKYYQIYNKNTVNLILKEFATYSSIRTENNGPSGLFVGWFYIGYVKMSIKKQEGIELILFCSDELYKKFSKKVQNMNSDDDNDDDDNKNNSKSSVQSIEQWRKTKDKWSAPEYNKALDINVSHIEPTIKQNECIDKIISTLNIKSNSGIYIIYGPPGEGKSYLSICLTKKLNGHLCNTYNPTEGYDFLNNLCTAINTLDKNKPLIVCIDEIDVILKKMHKNSCPKSFLQKIFNFINFSSNPEEKNCEVYDKGSWNRFTDDIQLGTYPNTIIICTMNESPEYIKKLDHSYIRDGRINAILDMTSNQNKAAKKKKRFRFF